MTEAEILADLEKYDAEPVNIDKAIAPKTNQQVEAPPAPPKPEKASEPTQPDLPIEKSEPKSEPRRDPAEAQATEEPKDDRPRDEFGRFLPKASDTPDQSPGETGSEPDKGDKQAPDDTRKPVDSNYEKAKKERERQASVLKNFEEEKRKAREQITQERLELARERQRLQEQMRQSKSDIIGYNEAGQPVYSEQALDAAAKAFETAGDFDKAELARAAIPVSRKFQQESDRKTFEDARNQISYAAMAENPDLGNQESPVFKEMVTIYDQEATRARQQNRKPLFEIIPDFMPLAADVAKLRMEAQGKAELQKQLEQLKTEIDRLNKLTSVNGSSPTQPRQPKTWQDMTTDEQLAHMDRMANFTPHAR